jgi:hypothetical protein
MLPVGFPGKITPEFTLASLQESRLSARVRSPLSTSTDSLQQDLALIMIQW